MSVRSMIKPKSMFSERKKLFVGGLSFNTTEESLRGYFSQYGEIIDCLVVIDGQSGRSRGFGFITFANPSSVDIVFQSGPHVLDNRRIDPKPYIPSSMSKKNFELRTPNGPPITGMALGNVMPGYQGWCSSPATGYGYESPAAPVGYRSWGVPETPQTLPQCGFTYSDAQQVSYGSYGGLYSRNTGISPANNLAVPQKNDYVSVGTQTDSATCKCYATEVTPSGIVAGRTSDSDIYGNLSHLRSESPKSRLLDEEDEYNINVEDDSKEEESNEDMKKTDEYDDLKHNIHATVNDPCHCIVCKNSEYFKKLVSRVKQIVKEQEENDPDTSSDQSDSDTLSDQSDSDTSPEN